MNFYDVLAAEKWGGGIPTINFFDLLFAKSMGGNIQWETYEGTLPATINANGDNLRQYQVWGNTGGVGDRTVQLFDPNADDPDNGHVYGKGLTSTGDYENFSQANISEFISITPFSSYTFTYGSQYNEVYAALYNSQKEFVRSIKYGGRRVITFSSQDESYLRFTYFRANKSAAYVIKGSTPPASFVPYGYEVDISTSDGTSTTTTPIYIGNDPLEKVGNYSDYVDYELQKVVRVIKKYVLTGNENWEEITGAYASRKYFRWIFAPINYCIRHVCVSSHFTQVAITTSTTTVGFDVFDSTSVNGEVLAIRPSGVQSTTLEDFKAWLAEQYAAGTPVTVWCTLTVAEEADPPVPLPALPTCDGTTVIDYAGESVAPEKVYFEYQGGKQP